MTTTKSGARSRVFRQTVTMEVVWIVAAGAEPPFSDWEAVVRDAIQDDDSIAPHGYAVPGDASVTEIEELAPKAIP